MLLKNLGIYSVGICIPYLNNDLSNEEVLSLKKKKLSVVIILSKDQSQKSYVFKLNFSKENGGLYE